MIASTYFFNMIREAVTEYLSKHGVDITSEPKKFSENFKYIANFDPQVLANGGYSMAVVFTSSTGGAEFVGAVGSELLIDEVKVIME